MLIIPPLLHHVMVVIVIPCLLVRVASFYFLWLLVGTGLNIRFVAQILFCYVIALRLYLGKNETHLYKALNYYFNINGMAQHNYIHYRCKKNFND